MLQEVDDPCQYGVAEVSAALRVRLESYIRIAYLIGRFTDIGGGGSVQKKIELTVGAKGEIYTTNEVRRVVGIEPRTMILAEVGEKQLILRPKERAEHLLEKPTFEAPPISAKQLSKLRRKLATALGER